MPACSVLLSVAAYDHKVNTTFWKSTLESQLALMKAGIAMAPAHIDGCCHVDDAYNYLLRLFLESDCTHVVTVGADQGWRGEDLLRLVQLGKKYPVVAGIVPKKTDEPSWNVLYRETELWANADGVIECDMVGTGFMCLSRDAVTRLAEAAEKYAMYEFDDVPLILERRVIGGKRFSGDNVLCLKWHELGGRVYVDPGMHFEHVGTRVWTGCAADWYREQMNEAADAA